MSKPRRLRPGGLTLVELLFAVSITAFVGLGVAGMFPAAFRSVVGGGQTTKATSLAQEMIDMVRSEPFDRLYATPSSGNGYAGYSPTYSTNSLSLPTTCPTGADSCVNKKKWTGDLLADAAQATGRGLPAAYGSVAVTCLAVSASSPYTPSTATCGTSTNLLRVSVTVTWSQGGARFVNLVTYVARSE